MKHIYDLRQVLSVHLRTNASIYWQLDKINIIENIVGLTVLVSHGTRTPNPAGWRMIM